MPGVPKDSQVPSGAGGEPARERVGEDEVRAGTGGQTMETTGRL